LEKQPKDPIPKKSEEPDMPYAITSTAAVDESSKHIEEQESQIKSMKSNEDLELVCLNQKLFKLDMGKYDSLTCRL